MAAPFIWINAFPGTGKLTIVKVIQSIAESVTISDNRRLASRLSRNDPFYQIEREQE